MSEDNQTSRIQMLASAAIDQQARICQVKMENIERELVKLTAQVEKQWTSATRQIAMLTEAITALQIAVAKTEVRQPTLDDIVDDMEIIKQQLIEHRQWWRIFAIVASTVAGFSALFGLVKLILSFI